MIAVKCSNLYTYAHYKIIAVIVILQSLYIWNMIACKFEHLDSNHCSYFIYCNQMKSMIAEYILFYTRWYTQKSGNSYWFLFLFATRIQWRSEMIPTFWASGYKWFNISLSNLLPAYLRLVTVFISRMMSLYFSHTAAWFFLMNIMNNHLSSSVAWI